MSAHTHRTLVEGCYRCDLSRDEMQCDVRPDCMRINGHEPICMKVVDGQWQVLPGRPPLRRGQALNLARTFGLAVP